MQTNTMSMQSMTRSRAQLRPTAGIRPRYAGESAGLGGRRFIARLDWLACGGDVMIGQHKCSRVFAPGGVV
jgi:hypothetical protein